MEDPTTYLFIHASKSSLPNGSARKVPIPGPVEAGTGVPSGLPVEVFWRGEGVVLAPVGPFTLDSDLRRS